MIEYKYADLFTQDTVDKQIVIEYDGGVITNTELFSESMELTETLCSESELRFGACEASVIKFKIGNMLTSLIGKWITVKMYLNGNASEPLQIGRYKVHSDKPTADRKWRDIVAYDAMYDIINTNVADWYNTILPNENSTVTMKAFRTSFLSHFEIEQEEIELINDNMTVEKTIQPDEISGKDVITAICEINGCFGHISREGKFRYVYLDRGIQGLFPRNDLYPADDLYPIEPHTSNVGVNGGYISAKYEDFSAKSIEKLQIRKEEDDIGVIVGRNDAQNSYIIEDNFLVYGKSTEELRVIADNILSQITMVIYQPYNATLRGNPCFEVGDAIRFITRYDLVESYVFQRTLKGIQALRDNFSAKGVEIYGQKINSLHRSIIELKGKSNVLTRTIEETQSTITDVENGLKTQITQTANSITSEVTRATSAESKLSTKITQNANSIMSEVTRATAEEGKLSTRIVQNADKISSKVSKGSVSSEISQESGQVKITAGRFIVESNYLDINKNGKSGEIVSKNGSGRYIKLNTGGLEGGYNGTAKCKIECSNSGLAFRGASMTFCMDNIYVGRGMNTSRTNKAYTGDIAYVAPTDGDVTKLNAAVLHVWNGLVLDNATYS